jgi:hypothetical protein
VDEYVTHGFKLAEINDGFDAMHVNGCLLISGFCLTVFSRAAIASVLSSTCHEFRRKGSEKNIVVLPVEYEWYPTASHTFVERRYNLPLAPRLAVFTIPRHLNGLNYVVVAHNYVFPIPFSCCMNTNSKTPCIYAPFAPTPTSDYCPPSCGLEPAPCQSDRSSCPVVRRGGKRVVDCRLLDLFDLQWIPFPSC